METIWAPNLEQLEKYYFLKVKSATKFDPWKWTSSQWVLSMLSFTYMMNQNITSVTDLHRGDIALHSAYKINYHWVLFLELEAPKYPLVGCYVCWNVSWPASADNVVKNFLFHWNFTPVTVVHHCIRCQCFILLPNVWVVFKINFAILHKIVAINNVQQSIKQAKGKKLSFRAFFG